MELNSQNLEWWERRIDELKDSPPEFWVGTTGRWSEIDVYHKAAISKLITSIDRVLDVGCGLGRLAPLFPDNKYVGIDFVPRFIEIAKQRNPSKAFIVADIKDPLPFSDKEFSVVLLVAVKDMLVKAAGEAVWQKTLAELQRVGNKVVVLDVVSGGKNFLTIQSPRKADIDKLIEIL